MTTNVWKNGWLAFALLAATCVGALGGPLVIPPASASAPSTCDWRYIPGHEDLPQAGTSQVLQGDWALMAAQGYRLVSSPNLNFGTIHVFEKCTDAPLQAGTAVMSRGQLYRETDF